MSTINPDLGLGKIFSEETAPGLVYKEQVGFHYRKKPDESRRGGAGGHRRPAGVLRMCEDLQGPTWQQPRLCTHGTEGETGGALGRGHRETCSLAFERLDQWEGVTQGQQ